MLGRFSLEERLWLKPELNEIEIEWIKYQLVQYYPERRHFFTNDVILTGFLRPTLRESPSDDILNQIINQRTKQTGILNIGDLNKNDFEFVFEFTDGLLRENCKYSLTLQRIYEGLDYLYQLGKKNLTVGIVLGNYLLAIMEFYGMTPIPLIRGQNATTIHRASKCLLKLVSSDNPAFSGLIIRLMPALTSIYFKSIKMDLLLSLRILSCIRELGQGISVCEQIVRALEKRAVVDFVPLQAPVKSCTSSLLSGGDYAELGNLEFPRILKHLRISKSRDLNLVLKRLRAVRSVPFHLSTCSNGLQH